MLDCCKGERVFGRSHVGFKLKAGYSCFCFSFPSSSRKTAPDSVTILVLKHRASSLLQAYLLSVLAEQMNS